MADPASGTTPTAEDRLRLLLDRDPSPEDLTRYHRRRTQILLRRHLVRRRGTRIITRL